MKKTRHSWLFAALTILLGVAVLTSTLLAPVMRVVLSGPTAVLEQNSARRSANALPGSLPPFAPVALSGPALFEVTDTRNGGWMVDEVVDVFSTADKQNEVRNPVYDVPVDAAHRQGHSLDAGGTVYDVLEPSTRLLHPGATGKYEFTVQNAQSYPIEWRLSIMEQNDSEEPIPMLYRLRSGAANYLIGDDVAPNGTWVPIPAAGLVYPPGPALKSLAALAAEPNLTLEWKWVIGDTAAEDIRDTKIGEDVADSVADPTLMPYYRLHFNLYAEAEVPEIDIVWSYIDPVTGLVIEVDRWHIKETDLGKTIRELMDLYGFTKPTPPVFEGHEFLGWGDKDGNQITDDYVVAKDKLVTGMGSSELQIIGKYNPNRDIDETYTIIWYYTDPLTGNMVEWDRWVIKKEDLGKTMQEVMAAYDFKGLPPPPEFPGYRFLGWRDKDGVEITPDYVISEDKMEIGAGGFEMHMEILGKYNSTGSIIIPPWDLPANLLPLLPIIPLVGLLPLIPLVALLPLLPLIPAALLLPFLPGWIGKLFDKDGGKDAPPYVKPPHTGDLATDLMPVYLLLAVSAGMVLIFGKKRKKDEQ